jgi:hypothetical protein
MYQNSEAPFFDCSRFKSMVQGKKSRLSFIERLNAWCDNFTFSKKREIFQELESLKHNGSITIK